MTTTRKRSPWSQGFPPEPDLVARKREAERVSRGPSPDSESDLVARKREAELWRFALRIKAEAMAKQAGSQK